MGNPAVLQRDGEFLALPFCSGAFFNRMPTAGTSSISATATVFLPASMKSVILFMIPLKLIDECCINCSPLNTAHFVTIFFLSTNIPSRLDFIESLNTLRDKVPTLQPSWCSKIIVASNPKFYPKSPETVFRSPKYLYTDCDRAERYRLSFPTPNVKLTKSHSEIVTVANSYRSALITNMVAPTRKSRNGVMIL